MSIENKLTYLDGTKQALKESINNLGGDITNETTFREYAQELDNIYDNLPKTTGEGTNLSLNTLKGKMNIIPKGNIEQETTTGKNLILCETDVPIGYKATDNGITWEKIGANSFKLNGTASANFTLSVVGSAELSSKLTNGTTYTISGCPSGGSDSTYRLQAFNFNGSNVPTDTGNGVTSVANISSSSNLAIRVFSGKTANNLIFNVQIEEGSTKTSFEEYTGGIASPNPSYPQDIKVVTETQEVKVENVNLIPFPYYDSDIDDRNGVKWTINNDGTINAVGTANFASSIFYLTNNESDIYLNAGTYKISSSFPGSQFNWQAIQIVNGNYGSVYRNDMVLTERTRLRVRIIAKANTQINATNCYLQIEKRKHIYTLYTTPRTNTNNIFR